MTRAARVAAQAKVNLLLRVLAREESGYHSIETVFLRLDLADDVVVHVEGDVRGRRVHCSGPECPPEGLGPEERNLAYRAAAAFAAATGWPRDFSIKIDKRIPVGSGLGGGSADAGAVLRALDALAPAPLRERLADVASEIGADVPFLTLDCPMALGWGRGQRLLPLPVPESRPIVLVMPPFGVSTADAYGWFAQTRVHGAFGSHSATLEVAELTNWDGITRLASNELEPVVSERHDEIAQYVARLNGAGAKASLMTGSGSAVFGVFDSEGAARSAMTRLRGVLPAGGRLMFTRSATRVEAVLPQ